MKVNVAAVSEGSNSQWITGVVAANVIQRVQSTFPELAVARKFLTETPSIDQRPEPVIFTLVTSNKSPVPIERVADGPTTTDAAVMFLFVAVTAVVPTVSVTVKVPATMSESEVPKLKVLPTDAEDELKVTLLNSGSERFRPENVIVVTKPVEVKVVVPVPLSHTAASVELFTQTEVTVQGSEPKSIADSADEMFTVPLITTAPDVDTKSPPDIVRLVAVIVAMPLLNVEAKIVNEV